MVSLVLPHALFWFQDPIQDTTLYLVLMSLGSSWLWYFLRLSLFLMTLVLRITGQVYCMMHLYWYMSDAFLMIRLGLRVFRRKITEVKWHFHHSISKCYSPLFESRVSTYIIWKSAWEICLFHLLRHCFRFIPQILVSCVFIYIHLKIF